MSANRHERTAKSVAGLFGRYHLNPLVGWWARQRAIDELMSLDDHTLRDILRRALQNSGDRRRQRIGGHGPRRRMSCSVSRTRATAMRSPAPTISDSPLGRVKVCGDLAPI